MLRTSHRVSAAEVDTANLILVGLPGSGKTTIGRGVAEALGRPFLDFDAEIERREHTPIAQIFGERGETHFRTLERGLTEELKGSGGYVLAPGGGWIANPGCLEALRPPAVLVYLEVEPARALKRMAAEVAARPLLRRPDPLGELERLLAARKDLYLLADHTVRVDFLREKEVVTRIVALAGGKIGD
jgi:shikimate kinase